jgi:hypothetical protein
MAGRVLRVDTGSGPVAVDTLALPRVLLTTNGGAAITTTTTYVPGTFEIDGAGAVANRPADIRGRGNSTWQAPKKPYRLKLGTATSLFGMPSSRDWVLLANYYDPSGIRTAVAFDIGRRCAGLGWTPRMRHVELWLNGVYKGLYQLGEHVKIAGTRINIDSMSAANTTGLPLTGGYTLEIDQRMEEQSTPGFRTDHDNIPVTLDDPDGAVTAQFDYIQGFVQDFEDALYSADWLDPDLGYARFIDRNSWIDWYLVNELCRNVDSVYYSSCKLYKTRDTAQAPGRLYFGPLWDFDNSINNGFRFNTDSFDTGWYTRLPGTLETQPGAIWHARMFTDPAFHAAMVTRWAALRDSLLTGPDPIADVIDRYANTVLPPLRRDSGLWTYTRDVAAELKTWLAARIAWIDSHI